MYVLLREKESDYSFIGNFSHYISSFGISSRYFFSNQYKIGTGTVRTVLRYFPDLKPPQIEIQTDGSTKLFDNIINMGIKGLLKGLHFATKKSNIREFRGCRLGIDFSCWVHRSVYSVAMSFVEASENNQITKKCVAVSSNYVIKRCQELLENFHVTEVVLVLDGTRIPLKHGEAKERERKQQANLREAREHKRNGRLDKAEEKYKMCVKIKNEFTEAVIMEVLKAFKGDNRVKVVWSPYEADAQLAKLCMDQLVDAVISEDSDLAVYSVTTKVAFPVIFKLDRTTGACDVISMSWLLEPSPTQQMAKAKSVLEGLLLNFASRELKRPGFGARLFVQGCVLAGCDYAANSLPGVGL